MDYIEKFRREIELINKFKEDKAVFEEKSARHLLVIYSLAKELMI